jgi:GT2 family glycosyltransferase
MPSIAVVILNYNGKQLLSDLLPTVLAHSTTAEVIVADNASTDGSIALLKQDFPTVRRIELNKNYGFAEGYNLALKQLQTDYYVLLNSDVAVTENWLQPLVAYMEQNPQTAACQPKLKNFNHRDYFEYAGACGGFIDQYGYPFCRGRILDTVEKDNGQYDEIADIFWATGACFFVRTADFWEVGGLDARFFAHMEEVDLCWRLKSRGKSIVCIPQSVVYHIGAKTLNADSPFKTFLNFRNNLLMIYKNMPSANMRWVLFVRWWLDILAVLHLLLQRKPKNALNILKAQWIFLKLRKDFRADRTKNLALSKVDYPIGFFKNSILIEYYLKSHKTAQSLFSKKTSYR